MHNRSSDDADRSTFLWRFECLPRELMATVRHRDLAAGEVLYRRGEKAEGVFVVEHGRMELFSYTTQGKNVPLYVTRAGECVAEAALFAKSYCGDVVAEIPSRVAMFLKEPLLRAFHQQPALADEFTALLTRRFNMLRVRLELRNLPSARERILQYLHLVASADGYSVLLDRPLKTLADDLGLTPESFYRQLAKLEREGLVSRRRGCIQLRIREPHVGDRESLTRSASSS